MKIPRPKHHIGDVLVVMADERRVQAIAKRAEFLPNFKIWEYLCQIDDDEVYLFWNEGDDKEAEFYILYNLTRNVLDQSTDTE